MTDIDKREYEDTINSTYQGTRIYVRDVDLSDYESKFIKGLILREKGFVDASKRCEGILPAIDLQLSQIIWWIYQSLNMELIGVYV